MEILSLAVILALIVVGFWLYFLPAFLAMIRNHRQTGPILIINLLLGWTLIGWVVALAWSFSAQSARAKSS